MKMMTKTATLACMLLLGFTVKLQAQSNQPADESWRNVARPGDSTEARLRSLLKDLEDNPPEATNDRLKVLAQIRKINAAMATRRQQNLAFDTRKLIEPGTVSDPAIGIISKKVPVSMEQNQARRLAVPANSTVDQPVDSESMSSTAEPGMSDTLNSPKPNLPAKRESSLADRVLQLEVELSETRKRLAKAEKKLQWLYQQWKASSETAGK